MEAAAVAEGGGVLGGGAGAGLGLVVGEFGAAACAVGCCGADRSGEWGVGVASAFAFCGAGSAAGGAAEGAAVQASTRHVGALRRAERTGPGQCEGYGTL